MQTASVPAAAQLYCAHETAKSETTKGRSSLNVLLLAKAKGSDDGVTDLVIPRGSNREKLHDEGQIANLVDINVNWTEEEVFQQIESQISTLIDDTKPFPR